MPTTALEGVHEAGAPLGKPLLASSTQRLLRFASPKGKAQWQRLASATTTHAKGFSQRANVGVPPAPGTTPSSLPPPLPASCYTPPLLGSARSPQIPPTLGVPGSRLLGRTLQSKLGGSHPERAGSGRVSPAAPGLKPPPRRRVRLGRHRLAPAPRPRGPGGSLGSGAPTPRSPSPGSSGRQHAPAPLAGLSVQRDGCARARLRAPAGQRTTRGARNPGSGGSAPKTPARRPGVPGSRSFFSLPKAGVERNGGPDHVSASSMTGR